MLFNFYTYKVQGITYYRLTTKAEEGEDQGLLFLPVTWSENDNPMQLRYIAGSMMAAAGMNLADTGGHDGKRLRREVDLAKLRLSTADVILQVADAIEDGQPIEIVIQAANA